MMDWIALIGVFGLGSVVTSFAQSWLNARAKRNERSFQERKEAYVGLLEAWVKQENSDFPPESFRDVGHWVLRSELVASDDVFQALTKWRNSAPGSSARVTDTNDLKTKMRTDLRS